MTARAPLRLPPHSLPGLEPLVNGALWDRWAADGIVFPVDDVRSACRYFRFKPDATSRLYIAGIDHHSATEPPQGMMLHLHPDRARAAEAHAKEMTRRHTVGTGGFAPFLCEESAIVGIPFPNDPEIPDLRHVYDPDRFRRTLSAVLGEYPDDEWRIQRSLTKITLLQYKPGRRAVYGIKVKIRRRTGDEKVRVRLHLKVENPRTCDRSHENLRLVGGAIGPDAPWRVPAIRERTEDRTVVVTEWVDGTPLRALAGDAAGEDAFRAVGAALAGFHRLPVELEHQLSPVEEGDQLVQHARDLAAILPDLGRESTELGEELACQVSRLAIAPSSPVHGDFHVDQVLLADGRPVIVDLDRAGLGYASHDVGNFLAHAEEIGVPPPLRGAFLAGYREACDEPLPEEWLRVSRSIAAFRRASFPFRDLREDWPAAVASRLAAARRQLEGLPR